MIFANNIKDLIEISALMKIKTAEVPTSDEYKFYDLISGAVTPSGSWALGMLRISLVVRREVAHTV